MRHGEFRVRSDEMPLSDGPRLAVRSVWTMPRVRAHLRLLSLTLAGALLAAWVGYEAGPRIRGTSIGQDTLLWTAILVFAFAMGVYAWRSQQLESMGRPLTAAGLLSILWLLQVSKEPLAFTVGWLLAGLAPPLLCYVMLSASTGHLHGARERGLILAGSATVAICWAFLALTSRQPMLVDPLPRCSGGCPKNLLFVGSASDTSVGVVRVLLQLAWLGIAFGAAGFLAIRMRSAHAAERRSIAPILLTAIFYALTVAVFLGLRAVSLQGSAPLGWISLAAATALPLAMLLGLAWERLFMGEALEEFVNRLSDAAPTDLRELLSHVLHDPSLRIAYARPAVGTYVDSSGARVEVPPTTSENTVVQVERDSRPVAVVIYDGSFIDQERFIRAAGTAAMISFENSQLEADLTASVVELAASRRRLVDSANTERERIERDLHDGIQQHIVGMQVKLHLAREAVEQSPDRGREMLDDIGREMDVALEDIRSVAQGVYPPLLAEYGLAQALRSAGRRLPCPVSVQEGRIGRYALDVEAAVYFCCLEALQNSAKHAGGEATVTVRAWEAAPLLHFECTDDGVGFDPDDARLGKGLINMRDRLAAVGGGLTVSSGDGCGTAVRGYVPIAGLSPELPRPASGDR